MSKKSSAPAKDVQTKYRSRIVDFKTISSSRIRPHPQNWRRHPRSQINALRAILNDVGYVQGVVVRIVQDDPDHDYELIDGHLRTGDADEYGVPAAITDLDEVEAKKILVTLDPLVGMADADERVLKDLMGEVDLPDEMIMEDIFAGESDDTPKLERILPDDLPGVASLKDDLVFPSSLRYEIPALIPEMIAEITPEMEIQTWVGPDVDWQSEDHENRWWVYIYKTAGVSVLPAERGIVSFYTDDAAFDMFWQEPRKYAARLLHFGFPIAMTPNFSIFYEHAQAVAIYNNYRSKWIGRYLQEAGIKIIPDVAFGKESTIEIAAIGIPHGCPTIAMQIQAGLENQAFEDYVVRGSTELVELIDPQRVLLYGEPSRVAGLFENEHWFDRSIIIANWSYHRVRQRYTDTRRLSMRTMTRRQMHEATAESTDDEEQVAEVEA